MDKDGFTVILKTFFQVIDELLVGFGLYKVVR